jgi:hypothetical protein
MRNHRSHLCPAFLLLAGLLLAGEVSPLPHAARAQPTLPTWRETGITFTDPTPQICFDTTNAQRLFVNEAAGTVAYNWVTGARTLVNAHRFDVCGPQGLLFAATPTGAWRFSARDPQGQPIDHLPWYSAADGTAQVYAVDRNARHALLWSSADGGLTWHAYPLPPDGTFASLSLATADAQILYATFVLPKDPYNRDIYVSYWSPDGGQTWEEHSIREYLMTDRGAHLALYTLFSRTAPVGTLVKEIYYARPSPRESTIVAISRGAGQVFTSIGAVGPSDDVQLIHTQSGLLRYSWTTGGEVTTGITHTLSFSSDSGRTWRKLPVPLPPMESYPHDRDNRITIIRVVPQAPANVLLRLENNLIYSSDEGQSWQQLPNYDKDLSALYISPALPLTVFDVQAGRLYRLDLAGGSQGLTTPAPPVGGPRHTFFPPTGHNLGGVFRQYWATHGGLAQLGYPLTEPFEQVADPEGRVYTTQYFERAVLEYHPDHTPPYEVLPRRLGADAYQQWYGVSGAPNQQVNPANPRFFPETGHTVGGRFRTYWEQHGGLAQQGYPVSDEFVEQNPLDGQPYTVQYFERAVFEWHPEYAGTPAEVLLRHLGTLQAQQFAAPPTAP